LLWLKLKKEDEIEEGWWRTMVVEIEIEGSSCRILDGMLDGMEALAHRDICKGRPDAMKLQVRGHGAGGLEMGNRFTGRA